ncbi:MAG: DUF3046 domain-containing protein [Microbacteriaceae bacterium]|nr:DUF3046 domain-containing protein [Microbacteriaceae bacterium]
MRLREFRRAVADEFGPRGPSLTADLVLGALGGRSADEAIAAGVDAGIVWTALCDATDVPPARRHGVGLAEPPR